MADLQRKLGGSNSYKAVGKGIRGTTSNITEEVD